MKIYFILIVFVLFVFLGIVVYFYYQIRYKFFKDMCFLCNDIKNNINFNKNDIDTIFSNIFQNLNKSTIFIIKNINNSSFNIIKKDEKKLINTFMLSLGNGDIDFETKNLDYYKDIFNEKEKIYGDEVLKKGSTYLKLIIGVGLIVCILLI